MGLDIWLAGLRSGVLGGVAMLGWLSVASAWMGQSIWTVPNLLATTFFGPVSLHRSLRWSTATGVSLHILLSGLIGLLFGFVVTRLKWTRYPRLTGIAVGIVMYVVLFDFFWQRLNPLVPLYLPDQGLLTGHVLFGWFLGGFHRSRRSLGSQEETRSAPEQTGPASPEGNEAI